MNSKKDITRDVQIKLNRDAVLAHMSQDKPANDIFRVIKRLLRAYSKDSLNPIFQNMDVTGVVESTLPIFDCLKIMTEYVDNHMEAKHAIYTVDNILEKNDVVMAENGISFSKKEGNNIETIKIPSRLGLVARDDKMIPFCVASTQIAYCTSETSIGIQNVFIDEQKCTLMHMPVIDAVTVRERCRTMTGNPNASRDIIYEQFYNDQELAILTMDSVFSMTKYHVLNPKLKAVGEKIKRVINEDRSKRGLKLINTVIKGAMPGVFKSGMTFKKAPLLNSIYATKFILEATIGGTTSKRGALTAGYYYMEITPHLIKAILRAKEIMFMLNHYGLVRVKLPTHKDYNVTLIRILLKNQYTVISDNGSGVEIDAKKVDHYRVTSKPCLEIILDCFTKPSWTKKGVVWYDDKFDSEMEVFSEKKNLCVMSTHLTPSLVQTFDNMFETQSFTMGYFPSLFPHACKIWLCTKPTYKVEKNYVFTMDETKSRFAQAMFARAKFPFTRKPYYSQDVERNLFNMEIVLPKVVRKEKNSLDIYKIEAQEAEIYEGDETVSFPDIYDSIQAKPKVVLSVEQLAGIQLEFLASKQDEADRITAIGDIRESQVYKTVESVLMNDPAYKKYNDLYDKFMNRQLESENVIQTNIEPAQQEQENNEQDDLSEVDLAEVMGDMLSNAVYDE